MKIKYVFMVIGWILVLVALIGVAYFTSKILLEVSTVKPSKSNGLVVVTNTNAVLRYNPAKVVSLSVIEPAKLITTNALTDRITLFIAYTNVLTNYVHLYIEYTNLVTNYVNLYVEYTNMVFASPVLLSRDWESLRFRIYKNEYEMPLDLPRWTVGLAYTPFLTNAIPMQILIGYRVWQGFGAFATLQSDRFGIGLNFQF